ncbi:MAG: hypothetical protein ACKOET_10750, partial [Verrucomicrobiota bacterium]
MATQNLTLQLGLSGLARVQAGLGSLNSSLGTVRSVLAGFGVSLGVGAVLKTLNDSLQTVAQAADLSKSFGISAESITSLGYAAKLSDVEVKELAKGLKSLNEWLQQNRIEVDSLEEALLQQAEVFSAMPDGPEKAAMAVDRFGKAGLALIPFLDEGWDGIAKLTAEARQFGIVVDAETSRLVEEFTDDLDRLKTVGQGLSTQIAVGLAPALREVTKTLLALNGSGSLDGVTQQLGEMGKSLM